MSSALGLSLRTGLATAANVSVSSVILLSATCSDGRNPMTFSFGTSMTIRVEFTDTQVYVLQAERILAASHRQTQIPTTNGAWFSPGPSSTTGLLSLVSFLLASIVGTALGCTNILLPSTGSNPLSDFIVSFVIASGSLASTAVSCEAGAVSATANYIFETPVSNGAASTTLSAGAIVGTVFGTLILVSIIAGIAFIKRDVLKVYYMRVMGKKSGDDEETTTIVKVVGGELPKEKPPVSKSLLAFGGTNPLFRAAAAAATVNKTSRRRRAVSTDDASDNDSVSSASSSEAVEFKYHQPRHHHNNPQTHHHRQHHQQQHRNHHMNDLSSSGIRAEFGSSPVRGASGGGGGGVKSSVSPFGKDVFG